MTPEQFATAADHLLAAKMYSLASCVMLFYDIAITFGDEVEKIWKQRFTGATVLWFLNRYLSPLGYIVIIVSFQDPDWGKPACERYILYPEVLKIFISATIGIIFILRLYSIYSKSKVVLYSFTMLLATELAIKIWAFTDGTMLQLPPGFVGCILTGKSAPGDRLIYTWVAELVFDSCVFFATLYRTIQLYRRTMIGEAQSLITVIMRDGVMYFAAIFVSNLVTVLIFVLATPDLKVINASFSTLITSLMVSRLMLNLRSEVLRRGPVIASHVSGDHYRLSEADRSTIYSKRVIQPATRSEIETGWEAFDTLMVGNLGAPVMTFERASDDDDHYGPADDDTSSQIHPHDDKDAYETVPATAASPRSPHSYPPVSSPPHTPHSAAPLFPPRAHAHTHSADGGLRPSSAGTGASTLHRQTSASSDASSLTFSPPRKARLSKARPPTAAKSRAERRLEREVDALQTRSLPAQMVVQVTEEVVVDAPPPGPGVRAGPGSPGESRPPWFAPPSWRISRDSAGRRGGADG
ncbi:uncharacterized protein BXZ73DRAFT_105103 [Epithele typhae]|uniref:uncharacterized protein n=1 Tax=Epithele typhae TaxID=378194 RepID=UPI0020075C65|nr:uncharacterized protein BXZ73DRAFT_105103 [Epithele typhae]KAH9918705.1 hypothetical protein BXZ73DRAFT_105103 [Epithele typhae]